MTAPRNMPSKSERALELHQQGLANWQIAARLNSNPRSVAALIRHGKVKRERDIERAGRLADAMGANV